MQVSAKIEQLSITGIRSFDNARPSTIKFYTPLTLIVGYNGSGKTTIIESLKYATTGDQPPNTKGGAFIHDPKLCGEKEVLAQVKLQFKSTNGATMVVTRNLQLTVQKTGPPKQKTLEGNLLMTSPNGERTTVSKRVFELDKIMPHYIGVSKAILDFVIFCHQDESLWPLSEPAALKKKFDEIFEAQKYTKAIDNIKQLRKNQGLALQGSIKDEATCKEIKGKADRVKKNLLKLQAEIEDLRENITELGEQAKEADAKFRERRKKAAQYESVVESLKNHRIQQKWNENTVKDLGRTLKKRPESDDWLQAELDQYDQRITVHQAHKDKQGEAYNKLQSRLKAAGDKRQAKYAECGRYEEQKANQDKRLEGRKALIKETARNHNIRGYDDELDDSLIRDFTTRISKMDKDQSAAMDKAHRETRTELQKVTDALSKLEKRQTVLSANKHSAKQQSSSNDQKITSYQLQINDIEADEGSRALLDSSVHGLEQKFTEAKDERSAGNWDNKLQKANEQIHSVEDVKEQLDQRMAEANKKASELAELDVLRKGTDERQKKLDTMTRAHGARLRDLVGQEWAPETLEGSYQDVAHERTKKVEDAKNQRYSVTTREAQIETKLSSIRSDVKRREKELESCAARIRDNLASVDVDPESYPQELERLQEERDLVKSDLDSFAFENDYFSKCLKALHNKHICKTCDRPVNKPEEKERLARKLNDALNRDKQEVEDDFGRLENELQRAKDARPFHSTWERLSRTELPHLRSQMKDLEKARGDIIIEIEEHDRIVEDREQSQKEAESLSKTVRTIVQDLQDLKYFRSQTEELATKQKDAGLSRTADDIQKELELLKQKLKSLRIETSNLSTKREAAHSKINSLELKLSQAKNKLDTANHQLDKKAGIERQIGELQQQNRDQKEAMRNLDEQLRSLAPQIAEEETKRDDIEQRGSDRQKELQRRSSELSNNLLKLKNSARDIEAYITSGGLVKLSHCQKEIEAVSQEISQIEDEQRQIVKEINKITEELSNQESNKRVIEDNLKYRKAQRDLEEIQSEISRLSAQNAEADLAQLNKEVDHWSRQYTLHSSARTGKAGTMNAKDEESQRLIHDWETDYKDAGRRFKEAHIKVETTKAAMEDLKRYMEALDKAITKYHSLKMEEINHIIEELWRRTYQGTDVDSISIRADNEGLKGNRTTNYRVVMVKQDTEMDMRGRCSAGQKVLASIIIRLALAECFGVSCGLIALDEPTTNLDRDNIRSLAESLHDIIRARQHQANFQLIVITHDEEFLRYMKCADFCDHYFRVSRDGRENSKIERQSIAEVL